MASITHPIDPETAMRTSFGLDFDPAPASRHQSRVVLPQNLALWILILTLIAIITIATPILLA